MDDDGSDDESDIEILAENEGAGREEEDDDSDDEVKIIDSPPSGTGLDVKFKKT